MCGGRSAALVFWAVPQCPPGPVPVALAGLYTAAGHYDEVINVTNEVTNVDDQTALLATYRGIALREQGHLCASRDAFKEALKSTKRDEAIRHLALFETPTTPD